MGEKKTCRCSSRHKGFSPCHGGRINTRLVKYGGLLLSSGHGEDLLRYSNFNEMMQSVEHQN